MCLKRSDGTQTTPLRKNRPTGTSLPDTVDDTALSLAAFELRYHQSLILLENSPVFYLKGIDAAYNTWYTLRRTNSFSRFFKTNKKRQALQIIQ